MAAPVHRPQLLQNLRQNPLFGCLLAAVIAVIVLTIVLVMLITRPPLSDLLFTPTPTATSSLLSYTNELYHFTLNTGSNLILGEGTAGCRGVAFSTDRDGLALRSTANPLLSVCYLEPARQNTAAFLRDRLTQRLVEIGPTTWTDAQIGLSKATALGKNQAPAAEVFVQGKDASFGRDVKWYVAIAQYDGRLYAVEASCPYQQWETCWPSLRDVIATLQFGSGIIP